VVVEDGSELVADLWAGSLPGASSIVSYPEGRAALAAARRAGRLRARGHARAREAFQSLHRELLIVGIDKPLAHHAGQLAEDHALRGYDAVHLASALVLDGDVVLVTWDGELRRAAIQSGCGLAPAH
jgi:predicted nucleic acid-binding protein